MNVFVKFAAFSLDLIFKFMIQKKLCNPYLNYIYVSNKRWGMAACGVCCFNAMLSVDS